MSRQPDPAGRLLTHCSHLSSVSWVATTSRAPARVTRSTTQSWAERASLWPHLYTGKVLVTMSAPYTPGSSARSSSSSLMQQAVVSRRTSPRYLQSYMLHRAVHTHTRQSGLAGPVAGVRWRQELDTDTGYAAARQCSLTTHGQPGHRAYCCHSTLDPPQFVLEYGLYF